MLQKVRQEADAKRPSEVEKVTQQVNDRAKKGTQLLALRPIH